MVWNKRLWSAPLFQPPWPFESITWELEWNDICEWAMSVSARASNRPLGDPSPVARS